MRRHPCAPAPTLHPDSADMARRNIVRRHAIRLADGSRTVGEISDIIANAYGLSPFRVRLDIRALIRSGTLG